MKDSFSRDITYLRLSITDMCNLRCRYCMPETGVPKKAHSQMLTQEETLCAVRAAASLGISKVRITGGEPLVKKNVVSLCQNIKKIPGINTLGLTTNATLLSPLAPALKNAGVSHLNISLDTLSEQKYTHITRTGNIKDALKGLEAALCQDFESVKINSVLIGGFNDDEIRPLAELTVKYPVDVRFIELMPMYSGSLFTKESFIPTSRVLSSLPELTPMPQSEQNTGAVAKYYRLPFALGKVGLISPISNLFCSQCNRIRITADGFVKPCLHSKEELSIKGLNEDEMKGVLSQAILAKPAQHGTLSYQSLSNAGRFMNQIGG